MRASALHVREWIGICLTILTVVLTVQTAAAEEYEWIEKGYGGGGRFTAAAVSPSDPAQVFIGSDVAGFYASADNGKSFKIKGAGLDGFAVAFIAPDPANKNALLILTDEGLYASKDGGETVARVNSKVRYKSRFFGSRLLLQHEGTWFAGTDSDGVFKLIPGKGGAWVASPLFGLQGKKVNSLAVYKGKLTAATDEGVFYHDNDIWKSFSDGLPTGKRTIMDMAVHPAGSLFAVEEQEGLYSYDERLNRWDRHSPLPSTLPSQLGPPKFKAVAVSPDNPDLVFLATSPKGWPHVLLRSQDGGHNWVLVKRATLTGVNENWAKDIESIEQITFSPDGKTVYLLDWWNVWRSVDGGLSWEQVHQGLQNTVVNDIQTLPARPGVFYVAADDNGLMVSKDDGRTWARRMKGVPDGHAMAVKLSAKNPDLVYLLVSPWKSEDTADTKFFHLYKSLDGGETWRSFRFRDKKKNLNKPFADGRATNLVIDPTSDDVVYVGTNGYGIYRIDTGAAPEGPGADAKATNISQALPTPYIKGAGALIVNTRDPKVIIAGTQEGGIFRTQDGGASWQHTGGAGMFIFGMATPPSNPSLIYAAAAEKQVLKSTDGGITWTRHELPGERPKHVAANSVAVIPGEEGKPETVVVGTLGYDHKAGDGVFISTDGGATFVPGPRTLPRAGINVLTSYTVSGGLALAGFNGLGVFELARRTNMEPR